MSTALARTPSFETQKKSPLSFAHDFFSEMQKIDEEIARSAFGLFQSRGSLHGSALDDWLKAESSILEPLSLSIEDIGDKLKITAEVPGFPEKDLRVHVSHDSVRICGKTSDLRTTPNGTESSTRSIRSSVTLPAAVEGEGVFFTVENGLLTLMLPKVGTAKGSNSKAA